MSSDAIVGLSRTDAVCRLRRFGCPNVTWLWVSAMLLQACASLDNISEADGGPVLGGGGNAFLTLQDQYVSSRPVVVGFSDLPLEDGPYSLLLLVEGEETPLESYDIPPEDLGAGVEGVHEFMPVPEGSYEIRLRVPVGTVVDRALILVLNDRDEDGVADGEDECPDNASKHEEGSCGCESPAEDELDGDSDGVIGCLDGCPEDRNKQEPGMCGCGFLDSEADQDSDGTSDCFDECPGDANKTKRLACGCGEPETDSDGDGVPDCVDVCVDDANKQDDEGVCGCGVADVDTDGDKVFDCDEECDEDPMKTEPLECGCGVAENSCTGTVKVLLLDTYVDANDAAVKDGAKALRITESPIRYALFKPVDLNVIPVGATVLKARFVVTVSKTGKDGVVGPLDKAWAPGVTYASAPERGSEHVAIVPGGAAEQVKVQTDKLTGLVEAWLAAPASAFGFSVAPSGDGELNLSSSEVPGQEPYVEVDWTTAPHAE